MSMSQDSSAGATAVLMLRRPLHRSGKIDDSLVQIPAQSLLEIVRRSVEGRACKPLALHIGVHLGSVAPIGVQGELECIGSRGDLLDVRIDQDECVGQHPMTLAAATPVLRRAANLARASRAWNC